MKKILTILMILAALFAFVACDTGNGSNGGGVGNVIPNPEAVAKEFEDCSTTIDASNVTFADGEWTVISTYSDEASSQAMTVQATVKNSYFTYTSGTVAATIDVEKMFQQIPDDEMPAETKESMIAALKAATDEEKTEIMEELQGKMPAGAKITWNGLIYSGSFPFDQEMLNNFNETLQFSENLDYFAVKTNADNTKYVLSGDENQTYYLEKNN